MWFGIFLEKLVLDFNPETPTLTDQQIVQWEAMQAEKMLEGFPEVIYDCQFWDLGRWSNKSHQTTFGATSFLLPPCGYWCFLDAPTPRCAQFSEIV